MLQKEAFLLKEGPRHKNLCLEDLYSGLLRCHRALGWWCLSHVKGHSSHALLHGLDGVTLVMRRGESRIQMEEKPFRTLVFEGARGERAGREEMIPDGRGEPFSKPLSLKESEGKGLSGLQNLWQNGRSHRTRKSLEVKMSLSEAR